jgi:hypothetical protein
MIPTWIGFVIMAAGVYLLFRGGVLATFAFVVFCGLFGGSSAINLPALGGSSVPPITFALGFLILRLLLPGSGYGALVTEAIKANRFLAGFIVYGVVMAYLGPRMFGADIKVVPMRSTDPKIYATYPLTFTSQNITASIYLLGTFACAAASYAACRIEGGARVLVGTACVIMAIHMTMGIASVVLAGTAFSDFLALFRNANYAMLDQQINGFVRMTGIMPEPSAYAGYGFTWTIFLIECWYRDVRPKLTGGLGLAMLFTLLASTSSTAYVSIAAYTAIFLGRLLLIPHGIRSVKLVTILIVAIIVTTLISAVLLLNEGLVKQLSDILLELTVNKQNSESGIQRGLWARQGLKAFSASSGIGIGPGSFRSSSIATAILGATGLIGTICFLCYLLVLLKPLRSSTYHRLVSKTDSTGVAATWAAFAVLIPAGIAAPGPDPGADFAVLAGASLALRLRGRLIRSAVSSPTRHGRSAPLLSS